MRMRREHLIGVCPDPDGDGSEAFVQVIRHSKDNLDGKGFVARNPPPERDIYLVIRMTHWESVFSISMAEFYGFAFDAKGLFADAAVRLDAHAFLDGIVRRLSRDNGAIASYGIKLTLFADGADETACARMYSFLVDWCARISKDVGVNVGFDIARDQAAFDHIMCNEHLRMVHGDFRRQCS